MVGWIGFIGLSALVQAASWQVDCSHLPQPMGRLAYCVHKPPASNGTILYYLHGRGGSERTWGDEVYYTQQLRDEWDSTGALPPTVVSVSFGPIWLLAERNASPVSGLYDLFLAAMPLLEAKATGPFKERLVLGESMGGFNAIQLALKTKLFTRAAPLCAPMAAVSPFSTPAEVAEAVATSRAGRYYRAIEPELVLRSVQGIMALARNFYPTPEAWESADPLRLAQTAVRTDTRIYLAAGFYDQYALYEGNERFAKTLVDRAWAVEWRPQWGGHCAFDIGSLAKFLAF